MKEILNWIPLPLWHGVSNVLGHLFQKYGLELAGYRKHDWLDAIGDKSQTPGLDSSWHEHVQRGCQRIGSYCRTVMVGLRGLDVLREVVAKQPCVIMAFGI